MSLNFVFVFFFFFFLWFDSHENLFISFVISTNLYKQKLSVIEMYHK